MQLLHTWLQGSTSTVIDLNINANYPSVSSVNKSLNMMVHHGDAFPTFAIVVLRFYDCCNWDHVRQSAFARPGHCRFSESAFFGRFIMMACQPRFLKVGCPGNADFYASMPCIRLFLRLNFAHYHPIIRAQAFLVDTGRLMGYWSDNMAHISLLWDN